MAIITLRNIAYPSETNVAPAIMTRFEPFGFNPPNCRLLGVSAPPLSGFFLIVAPLKSEKNHPAKQSAPASRNHGMAANAQGPVAPIKEDCSDV